MPEEKDPAEETCVKTNPNTPIDLYKGYMNIIQSSITYPVEGSIQLKWLPSPSIRFDIPKMDHKIDTGNAKIELPKFASNCDVIVTKFSFSMKNGVGSIMSCRGFLNPPKLILKNKGVIESCDEVSFCLPNFTPYVGSIIREGIGGWRGRLNLKNDEWEVTLNQHRDERKIIESLEDQGGFAVIHTGILRRCDGGKFKIGQAKDILLAIQYFFSFVRGAWCGPISIKGVENSKINWEIWYAPRLTEWKSVSSWFDKLKPDDIQDTFDGFIERWDDPKWKEALTTAIHWYITSNINTGGVEGSMVLTQTALELLSWVYLIETPSVPAYTIEQFNKMTADIKIKKLLESMKIQTHIPPELNNLLSFRKNLRDEKGQKFNGPQIFTFIRNRIVHDRTDDPDKLSDIPRMARVEASWLGLWYLVPFQRNFSGI